MIPRHVLIADDNPDDRDLAARELRKEWPGIQTTFAYDERTLADAVEGTPADLVVTDYHLRFTDGFDVLRRVREAWPDAIVVMYTGTGNEEVAVEGMKKGLDDYVLKQHLQKLVPTVRTQLQHRRARRQRDETEGLLRTALEAAPIGVGFVDRDLRYIRVNETLARYHGVPADEHIGRRVDEVVRPPGVELDDPLVPHYQHVLDTGESIEIHDLRARDADGERHYRVLYHPVQGGGEVIGVGVVAIDETERRVLEEQFLQAQKLEAVGRLAGGVAHDFNNLLAVINGYAHLIEMALPRGSTMREQAREIVRAAQQGASLTGQLLAYSRHQGPQAPEVVDLNAVVADLVRMVKRLVPEEIDLEVDTRGPAAPVAIDAGRVGQVLVNLVVNAIDAMPRGGRLTVAVAVRRQTVELAVVDTGVGMDPQTRARIFDPFFTTKSEKGTGLGLSTVHGIVDQAGGSIDVVSAPGEGTRFVISLPRVSVDALPQAEARRPAGVEGQGETVLVVEDNPMLRSLLSVVLEGGGYVVVAADDGAQALALVRDGLRPAVVVSDLRMPTMGGLELREHLVREAPGSRILLVSGYAPDDGIGQIEGLAFLQKPFSPAELLARVAELVAGEGA